MAPYRRLGYCLTERFAETASRHRYLPGYHIPTLQFSTEPLQLPLIALYCKATAGVWEPSRRLSLFDHSRTLTISYIDISGSSSLLSNTRPAPTICTSTSVSSLIYCYRPPIVVPPMSIRPASTLARSRKNNRERKFLLHYEDAERRS